MQPLPLSHTHNTPHNTLILQDSVRNGKSPPHRVAQILGKAIDCCCRSSDERYCQDTNCTLEQPSEKGNKDTNWWGRESLGRFFHGCMAFVGERSPTVVKENRERFVTGNLGLGSIEVHSIPLKEPFPPFQRFLALCWDIRPPLMSGHYHQGMLISV